MRQCRAANELTASSVFDLNSPLFPQEAVPNEQIHLLQGICGD